MILPGLISAAFYRRRPSRGQIALGLAFTIVSSAALGYWQDAGTSRVWLNVALAIAGGVILYFGILAILVYWYFPTHPPASGSAPGPSAPRSG